MTAAVREWARNASVPLALAWGVGLALHVVLSATAPRGILTDSGFPWWCKVSLLAAEGVALLIAGLLAAPVFAGLRRLEAWRFRRAWRALGLAFAAFLALAYASTWMSYWISGRFLDAQGLRFYLGNSGIMLGYALEMHPVALRVLPLAASAFGGALAAGIPWAGRRLGEEGRRRVRIGFVAAAAAAGLAGAAGEWISTGSSRSLRDPETSVLFDLGEYYRMRRDFRAGPLIHAFVPADRDAVLRMDPAFDAAPMEIERRPLLGAAEHLARVDPSGRKPWNVVVVVVDSLRADQLSAYGASRDVMPNMNRVAAEGRVYADMYSNGSMTDLAAPCPSTSHYPFRRRTIIESQEMFAAYPRVMLHDLLKAAGYRTGFMASNNEFWCGTVHLLWTPSIDRFVTAGERIPAEGPRALARRPSGPVVDDATTIDEALAWLGSSGSAPFYLFLNLQNGHAPYRTPEGYARPFGRAPDYTISAGFFPLDRLDEVRDVYADSLHYVDHQIGRLISRLKETGEWDRTLFVLTADHGEAFHEHGFGGHGSRPFDEVMRVPLVMRAPGLAAGKDETPAQLIDIAPTVAGLLGIPPHPSFQGVDLADGAKAAARSRFLLSLTVVVRDYAIVRDRYKLIYDADLARYLLFDRREDPGEKRDLAPERPSTVRDLAARLHAWRRAQLEYYENPSRWASEFPPALIER